MSYFVYKVKQDKSALTLVQAFDVFKDASAHAKALRRDLTPAENVYIKLVHAKDQAEAERLLTEKRQPSSPIEEWET